MYRFQKKRSSACVPRRGVKISTPTSPTDSLKGSVAIRSDILAAIGEVRCPRRIGAGTSLSNRRSTRNTWARYAGESVKETSRYPHPGPKNNGQHPNLSTAVPPRPDLARSKIGIRNAKEGTKDIRVTVFPARAEILWPGLYTRRVLGRARPAQPWL